MNRDEVRRRVNIIQTGQFHLQRLGAGRRDVRIEGQHAHAERHCATRHLAADAAHAQHAECLAVKFDAFERLAVPFAGGHRAVGLRDIARECHHHREGQLAGGDRVAAGSVHDDHAVLCGGLDVDVVNADPGAADNFHLRRSLEQRLGDFGLGADSHR